MMKKDTYEPPKMEIDSREEFDDLISGMYCTENCFEGMQSWVGNIISSEKTKEVLTLLADDSHEHKKRLEELISKIDGIEPDEKLMDEFDFKKGMDDRDILESILERDQSALYNYSLMKIHVDKEFLKTVMSEEDIESFYETLEYLIKEEIKHIKLLRSKLDKMG